MSSDSMRTLPMDAAVHAGALPNGLRYYIRHNAHPANRAELRLVVNAGSVLEDDTQSGAAHFIEHMAFNGSTHFPKNALIRYLESIGMRFGADLNAHTGYDETVYEVTVPTDSGVLDTALTILDDWAHGIRFDSTNVVAERRVITEEWRLRSSAATRIQAAYDSVMYRGTPYPQRAPIGTFDAIQQTNPAALERFYADWYRPDLMTIVAVGDFDVTRMEVSIRRRFARLTMPAHPRPRPTIVPVLPAAPTVTLVDDPGQVNWAASIIVPKPFDPNRPASVAAFRAARIDNVFTALLNQQIARTMEEPRTPLLSAQFGLTRLQRGPPLYRLMLTTKPNRLEEGITVVLLELERLARAGISTEALDHARQAYLRGADDETADATASSVFAAQYVQNALTDDRSLSPTQARRLLHDIVPAITPADIRELARRLRASTAPIILAALPTPTTAGSRPSVASILSAMTAVDTAVLPIYQAHRPALPLVANPPVAGTIVREHSIPSIGVTEWILSNGIRVLVKLVRGDDKLYLTGTRPGGYALADPAIYPSAAAASLLVGSSGLGAYSNDDLRIDFAGLRAGVGVGIGEYDETINGQSGTRPRDIALLFQLAYLKFVAPRIDTAYIARWKTESAHPTQIDQLQQLLSDFLRNGHPFGRPILGPIADSVDAHQSLAFYRTRFGDASGFTIIISGPVAPETLRPYVEQYLASLPVTGTAPATRDPGVRPKAGPVRQLMLTRDGDPQARTALVYTDSTSLGIAGVSRETAEQVLVLSQIVQERLTYTLRQRMGGVYVVQVGAGLSRVPFSRIQLQIAYTADPRRLEELHRALLAQLDSLQLLGPTPDELRSVKTAVRRSLELAEGDASTWADRMTGYVTNGWSLDGLAEDGNVVQAITAQQLQTLARALFAPANCIEVASMPQQYLDQAHLPVTGAPSAPPPSEGPPR